MKTKFLLTVFAVVLCSAVFSSCAEEEVLPSETKKTEKGVEMVDKGGW